MKKAGMIALILSLMVSICGCAGVDGQIEETPALRDTELSPPPAAEQQKEAEEKEEPELTAENNPAASEEEKPKEPEVTAEEDTDSQPESEPEPEPVAEVIQGEIKMLISGKDTSVTLGDNNSSTYLYLYPEQTIIIESDTPFSAVYMNWCVDPGEYTVCWDGGSQLCGENGFLQEYIRLPEAVTRAEIVPSVESYMGVTDISILSAGSAPDGFHEWLPSCEEADILVFPTHSDDDVLFFGTLISYYSIERELKVQTAFMVNHFYQQMRGIERLNGLWEMGVRYYPFLYDAPDSATLSLGEAMAIYESYDIEQWQVEMIRRFRPLVVVGHDLMGEYGNGGHMVNAFYLVQAIEKAADPEAYPESAEVYGVWDSPKLYIHLYEENEILLDVETPMENDPLHRTPFQVATDAFKHHQSQHQYGFSVQTGINRKYDCRPFGLYRTLVGEDTCADIMDHIDPSQWR